MTVCPKPLTGGGSSEAVGRHLLGLQVAEGQRSCVPTRTASVKPTRSQVCGGAGVVSDKGRSCLRWPVSGSQKAKRRIPARYSHLPRRSGHHTTTEGRKGSK